MKIFEFETAEGTFVIEAKNAIDKENEIKGTGKPFVKKLNIDLNDSDLHAKFNPFDTDNITKIMEMMASEEIKAIIHNFYKKEYKYFLSVGIHDSKGDGAYKFIMLNLQEYLSRKYELETLNELESILYLILYKDSSRTYKFEYSDEYSDELVNGFKSVLKEVL